MSADPADATDYTTTHRKPPFLRRVRIRNFKSIKFCDVTLEPLTVLVGRNGSGKSNFVEALAFLRNLLKLGLRHAVNDHGGADRLLPRRAGRNRIGFDFEFEYSLVSESQLWPATYNLELDVFPAKSVKVAREEFRFGADQQNGFVMEQGTVSGNSSLPERGKDQWYLEDKLVLNSFNRIASPKFTMKLDSLLDCNFRPDLMRIVQPLTQAELLNRTGSNLASVLESTRLQDPASFQRLQLYFSSITGTIEFLGVKRYGTYETPAFRVSCGNQQPPLEFDAASMSDGSLRAIAALAAAYQSVPPFDSPSLVAIEEPETSLHPAAMHALVDALDEATGRTQILLTTHSAELLDNDTIKPENVRVVEMVNGETVITPVDEASVEIVKEGLNTLGELQRGDQLELHRKVVRERAAEKPQ